MAKKRKVEKWRDEEAMFTSFMREVEDLGFETYPESCGHDLILRAGPDLDYGAYWARGLEPGDQVALEGKLRPNLDVLRQALPPEYSRWDKKIPPQAADFYGVVVPEAGRSFLDVADALGIIVFSFPTNFSRLGPSWIPMWRDHYRLGRSGLELPPRVVMPAGRPGPRSVTKWKLHAVELCLRALKRGGTLMTTDFVGTVVRPRTFLDRGWMSIVQRDDKTRRVVAYRITDSPTRPDLQYPEICAAIQKDLA